MKINPIQNNYAQKQTFGGTPTRDLYYAVSGLRTEPVVQTLSELVGVKIEVLKNASNSRFNEMILKLRYKVGDLLNGMLLENGISNAVNEAEIMSQRAPKDAYKMLYIGPWEVFVQKRERQLGPEIDTQKLLSKYAKQRLRNLIQGND